jgi:hypothetical protein
MTPGFGYSSGMFGLMSHAQWITGKRIRRLLGDAPGPFSLFVTQPY